jgi:hypothetical protein
MPAFKKNEDYFKCLSGVSLAVPGLAVLVLAAVGVVQGVSAGAQSLDAKKPTPLAAGENRGTVDNMVGPQFWSFKYKKGDAKITVRFTSMGLFGNAQTTTVNVLLKNPEGQVFKQAAITSGGREVSMDFPGTFGGPGTAILEIRPTGNALVRAGGDYSITLSGSGIDLAAGAAAAAAAPAGIVGTYAVMVCAPDFDCQSGLAIRFNADGTAATTDGHSGTWKLFDPDAMIYTLTMGGDRWTLKLVPGRGLFATTDLSVVVFQAIRPR